MGPCENRQLPIVYKRLNGRHSGPRARGVRGAFRQCGSDQAAVELGLVGFWCGRSGEQAFVVVPEATALITEARSWSFSMRAGLRRQSNKLPYPRVD